MDKARAEPGRIRHVIVIALRRELLEFCRDRIAVYKWPREVAFVPQLPRAPGPAGAGPSKLLRRVLREQAEHI